MTTALQVTGTPGGMRSFSAKTESTVEVGDALAPGVTSITQRLGYSSVTQELGYISVTARDGVTVFRGQ